MKVVKAINQKKVRSVTLRLKEEVMQQIDRFAEDNGVSRQRLIERILEQTLGDKNFVVKI
jgi:predicted DNA binding CopG/RHH family protein